MTGPPRIAVIAGSVLQYRHWCRSNGHNPHCGRAFYATAVSLRGMSDVEVVRTGSWADRGDLADINATLQYVNRKPAAADDLDDEPYMTVARMEQIMTPRMAAHVLAQTAMFRLAVGRGAYTDRLDKLLAGDGHHLAFVYALHAVAEAGVTVLGADAADLAVLGVFGRRLEEAPEDPRTEWRRIARPDQLLPPLEDPWRVFLLTGGRGSGKSRSGAQGLTDIILSDTEPDGQYGICAPTYRDAWTVDVEGESGILRALGTTPGEVKHGTSRMVEYAHRSYGEIGLRNGHVIYVDSADDGALRIQGKNLRGIWCDEIGLWQRWQVAWDESIRYAVRKGTSKIIATGTPKVSRPARALLRRLLRGEEPGVIVRRLRTVDNAANLSEAFYASVIGAAKGTRLERQELEGELLDDVANALWTRALLEDIQVPAVGAEGSIDYLHGAVIGVDPSDGNEDSDEQAYTIAGKGNPTDRHLYVVESWGGQMAPAAFAKRVILKAVEWNARIVVERNHGGAWLTATFHQVLKDLDAAGRLPEGRKPRVETVWASQAKRTRAEPVSALYERGLVRHAGGPFVELEDQMCSFTAAAGERSPDRLDSLVFSLHPFLNASFLPPGQPGVRKWAGAQELADQGIGEEARAHRKMREIHERGQAPDAAPWDLEGFAPGEDREADDRARPRGNVRSWR